MVVDREDVKFVKEKKYWNGWIKIFFEAMAYFFVFIAGLGVCILVTAF